MSPLRQAKYFYIRLPFAGATNPLSDSQSDPVWLKGLISVFVKISVYTFRQCVHNHNGTFSLHGQEEENRKDL